MTIKWPDDHCVNWPSHSHKVQICSQMNSMIFSETGQELLKSMSKAEFITSVTLAGRREMDLAADVAKEKFVQKIIDFEKVPSVSVKCSIDQKANPGKLIRVISQALLLSNSSIRCEYSTFWVMSWTILLENLSKYGWVFQWYGLAHARFSKNWKTPKFLLDKFSSNMV